jgi:4-hydroxy-3-polyprenylbenzoate decarboxylase
MGELKISNLRDWMSEVEKIGELARIKKEVDPVLEMSSLAYLNGRNLGQPTLLYENPKGFDSASVLFNPIGSSFNRLSLAFRAKPGRRPLELVQYIRNNFKKIPPVYVDPKDAPIFENEWTGEQINLFHFPIPQHWPRDGGKYIGTGDVVITQDPETGRYNVGTYRHMALEKDKVGFFTSPGKGGGLDREKWWAQGKPMPVVAVYGVDPLLMIVGSTGFGNHESEFDYAGGFSGEPVKLVKGKVTGLPIPADCELAIEGYVYPERTFAEGPFGEFTGYYGKPGEKCPYVQIEAVYFRNKPILTAAMMADKPGANEQSVFLGTMRSAKIWRDMEAAGVAGIKGVWSPPAGAGGWGMTVISIKQMFAGHAQQAAMIAAGCAGGGFYSKFYYIVDDDVDPSDLEEVMWAATTRCRCSEDIEILRNTWSTPLDPSKNPPEDRAYGSKAFIFACKQHKFLKSFSHRTAMTRESYEKALVRWNELGMPGEPPIIGFFDDLK